MKQTSFEAVWESWVGHNELFESRPGVFVKIGNIIDTDPASKRLFSAFIKAGFIFETKPKEYRVVLPYGKGHTHHFVCECGAEA